MHRVAKHLRWIWEQVSTGEPLWSFGRMCFFLDMFVLFFKEELWKLGKLIQVEIDISNLQRFWFRAMFLGVLERGEVNFTGHIETKCIFNSVGVLPSDTSQRRPFEAWVMLIMVIFYAIMLVYITARPLVRKTANIWPCTTEQLSSYASIAFGIWCLEVRMFWCVQYSPFFISTSVGLFCNGHD